MLSGSMQTRSGVQSSHRVCSARPSFVAGQFQSWHRADVNLCRPVAPRALQAITLLDTVTASGPLVDLAATDTSSLNAAAFIVATVAVAAYSYWQQQQQGDSSTATSPDVGSAKPSEWASMAATPSATVAAPAPPQPATPEPQPETDDVDSWIAHWRSTSGTTTIDTLNASNAAVAAGAALGADTASDSSAAGAAGIAGAATKDAPIVPEVARVDEASVVAAAAAAAAQDAAKGSATSTKGREAASPHPLDMPSAGNARLQAGANVERNAGNGTWNPIVLLLRLLARMWRWVMSLFSGGSASSGDVKTA